jgi:hypothetical protein
MIDYPEHKVRKQIDYPHRQQGEKKNHYPEKYICQPVHKQGQCSVRWTKLGHSSHKGRKKLILS